MANAQNPFAPTSAAISDLLLRRLVKEAQTSTNLSYDFARFIGNYKETLTHYFGGKGFVKKVLKAINTLSGEEFVRGISHELTRASYVDTMHKALTWSKIDAIGNTLKSEADLDKDVFEALKNVGERTKPVRKDIKRHRKVLKELSELFKELNDVGLENMKKFDTLNHLMRSYGRGNEAHVRVKIKRVYNDLLESLGHQAKIVSEVAKLMIWNNKTMTKVLKAFKLYKEGVVNFDPYIEGLKQANKELKIKLKDLKFVKKFLHKPKLPVNRWEKKLLKYDTLFSNFQRDFNLFLRHNLEVSRAAQELYNAARRLQTTPPDELHNYERLIYNKQNDLFRTLERLSKALDMYANIKVRSKVASSVFKTQAASNLSIAYDTLPDILTQLREDVRSIVNPGRELLKDFHDKVLVVSGEDMERLLPAVTTLLEKREETLKAYKNISYKQVNKIVKVKYKVAKTLSKKEKLKPSLREELAREMVAMHKLIASSSVLGSVGSVMLAIPRKTGIKELQKELKENEKIAKRSSKPLKLLRSIEKDTLKHVIMRRAGLLRKRELSYSELDRKLTSVVDVISDVSRLLNDYKRRGEFQTSAERKETAKRIEEEIIQPILHFQAFYIKVNKRSKRIVSISYDVAKETIRFMDNLMNLAERSKEIIEVVSGHISHS